MQLHPQQVAPVERRAMQLLVPLTIRSPISASGDPTGFRETALLQNAANLINAGPFDIQSFHPFQGVLSQLWLMRLSLCTIELFISWTTISHCSSSTIMRIRGLDMYSPMVACRNGPKCTSTVPVEAIQHSNGGLFYQLIGSLHTEPHNTAVLKPLNAYAGVSKARFRITGPDSLMDRSTLRLKARTRRS